MKKPNKQELKILREKFIVKFCKEKGWNKEELTTRQMLVLIKQQGYLTPTF